MRGEKAPDTVDLTPKLQTRPKSRTSERSVAATRSCADNGEEPEHDEETPDEACAQPKQEIQETEERHDPPNTKHQESIPYKSLQLVFLCTFPTVG